MQKTLATILGLIMLVSPLTVFAVTTYNLNCTNDGTWKSNGTGFATCSGANFNVSAPSGAYWESTASLFSGGGSWYVSFTYSGSGAERFGDIVSTNDQYYSSSQVAANLGSGLSGTFVMYNNLAGPGGSFVGTISNLCITDTSGACEGGGAPPPRFNPFILFFGAWARL